MVLLGARGRVSPIMVLPPPVPALTTDLRSFEITAADVDVARSGNDLVITNAEHNLHIVLEDYYVDHLFRGFSTTDDMIF